MERTNNRMKNRAQHNNLWVNKIRLLPSCRWADSFIKLAPLFRVRCRTSWITQANKKETKNGNADDLCTRKNENYFCLIYFRRWLKVSRDAMISNDPTGACVPVCYCECDQMYKCEWFWVIFHIYNISLRNISCKYMSQYTWITGTSSVCYLLVRFSAKWWIAFYDLIR